MALPKLGIVAGSGDLPQQVIAACQQEGREIFVLGFDNITDPEMIKNAPHATVHIGKIGDAIKRFKQEQVDEIVLVGRVGRPPLSSLNLDFSALKLITRMRKLRSLGDNAVFSTIILFLEDAGFKVVGVDSILKELLIQEGPIGFVAPDSIAESDVALGKHAAKTIGDLDIGQAIVIQNGVILGVEGIEGTDQLISRCAALHQDGPGGVLVKVKKPKQDTRVDLPSIGVHTIENAHASGLRGIALEAGGALVIHRERVIEKADELGIFVTGIAV